MGETLTYRVERLEYATENVCRDVSRLLPYLTSKILTLATKELNKLLRQPHFFVLVARAPDGKIIGMATIYLAPTISHRSAYIEDVVVDPEFREHGIAQQLLEELIVIGQSEGAERIDLTSRSDRVAARNLYRKLGFQKRDTNVYRLELKK